MSGLCSNRTWPERMPGISHDDRLSSESHGAISDAASAASVDHEASDALAVECVWCTPRHELSPGRYPASSTLCDVAKAKIHAQLDAEEIKQQGAP